MRRTWAAFKHDLRYCRAYEEQIRVDAYAADQKAHDSKKLWEQVQKDSCRKATLKATLVNGVVDEKVLPPCGKPTLNVRHFYMAQWHTKTDGSYSYPILMVS